MSEGPQGEKGDKGNQGNQGFRGERGTGVSGIRGEQGEPGKDAPRWTSWVPLASSVLLVFVAFLTFGASDKETRHFEDIQAGNVARDTIIENLAEKNAHLIYTNCLNGKIVYSLLRYGFATREEDQGKTAADKLLQIRNCAATAKAGENVFLKPKQQEYVVQQIIEHQQMPVYNAKGELTNRLSLPDFRTIKRVRGGD